MRSAVFLSNKKQQTSEAQGLHPGFADLLVDVHDIFLHFR